MRVAVSIGHNPDAPGACNGKSSEYSTMAPVAGALIGYLMKWGHHAYMIGTGSLEQKVSQVNQLKTHCAVELHLNSGGGRGTETLYCPSSIKGKLLAESVQKTMVTSLVTINRGAKEGWYRMIVPPNPKAKGDYFLTATTCPSIITEAYFIDTELDTFDGMPKNFFQLGMAIALGIEVWGKEEGL